MRRSLLFIPANNPAMLQNSDVFSSDGVIFDLEDAVSINEKDSARNLLKQYLKSFDFSFEVIIRINGFDTPYFLDDLKVLISEKINTIMLPKASQFDLIELDKILGILEQERSITKPIGIIPIIELASSVLEVENIARSRRVNGILLGAEDLTTDLGVSRTLAGDEILYARQKVAMTAKAFKIDAIDTPFTDVNNEEGLLYDSNRAKSFAMNAKACIHPNQIPIVNKVFSPSLEMINYSLRVIEASKKALKEGIGAFSLDGKMIDKPIIERANKVILQANKFGLLKGEL